MAFDTSGIRLKPCVDLFSTEASRQDAGLEKIREIPLDQLVPFKDHPFKVIDDESMMDTVQSIREHGILLPLIARPMPDGKYEIVSGHRRSHAGKLAGLETVPVIVRELDDDAAVILMVDSNLQRENILPSERAFAFKMKLEAMKHQGKRLNLTSDQVGQKLRARDVLGNELGMSSIQIQRYIRLTELLPELLDLVDERKFAFNSAVEVSYLNPEEQGWLAETIDSEQSTPSLSQGTTPETLFAGRQTDRRYGAGNHVRAEKAGNRKGRAAKQTDIPIFLPIRNAERNGNLDSFHARYGEGMALLFPGGQHARRRKPPYAQGA